MGSLFWGGAIGLGLLSLGGAGVFWELRHVRQIKAWPHTIATILDSCVREHGSGDYTTYTVYLLYQYTANGVPYTAHKDIKSLWQSIGAAEKLFQLYPAGRTDLPVACNPQRPEQHQIADDRNRQLNGAWLGMCAIFVAFGTCLLFLVAAVLIGSL